MKHFIHCELNQASTIKLWILKTTAAVSWEREISPPEDLYMFIINLLTNIVPSYKLNDFFSSKCKQLKLERQVDYATLYDSFTSTLLIHSPPGWGDIHTSITL